ncbi:MAG TPA: response regulator transcription factor [Candidatus Baltobacteraceae bacterium]|nr:response regulator transcription factor [Candidatus Baltobacteraceae bacterium]
MDQPKILIVDDHEIVREGIRTLLGRARPQWVIVGEAGDAMEALAKVKILEPDIVILDITMPGVSGLEAAVRINKLGLHAKILIFTMHESDRLAKEVRDVGARGYVLKSQAARDLVQAIERILSGGTFSIAPPEGDGGIGGRGTFGVIFRVMLPPAWAS